MKNDTICTNCLRLKQDLCDGEKELTACPSYKRMTYGDRIRAMTDEELAKKLYEVSWSVALATDMQCAIATEEDWLDRLKQEVSE